MKLKSAVCASLSSLVLSTFSIPKNVFAIDVDQLSTISTFSGMVAYTVGSLTFGASKSTKTFLNAGVLTSAILAAVSVGSGVSALFLAIRDLYNKKT